MKITESKVFHLLRCLSGPEIKKLHPFIDTRLAGPPGMAGELLTQLMPYHPDFNEEQVTKESLWLALFGSGKPQEQKLRYAFSDLYRHTSMYLSVVTLVTKEEDLRCMLREALSKRGTEKEIGRAHV